APVGAAGDEASGRSAAPAPVRFDICIAPNREVAPVHRMSLGNVELTVLEDGTWRFPARAFFDNVAEARWRAEIDVDEDGKIPVGHNCALVESRDDVILIDTGYGADTHGDCTGHLLAELERAGRRPEDVTLVINTHAHGDHIKGNT